MRYRQDAIRLMSGIEHNSSAKLILVWLLLYGNMPRAQLAAELHIGEATLKRSIKLLKELGVIDETTREVTLLQR